MAYTIRPWRTPDDLPRIAEICTYCSTEPVTVAALEADQGFPSGAVHRRLVATDRKGVVVAYGWVRSLNPEGHFTNRIVVDPALRRQGIGSALLEELEGFGRENGATRFECRILDIDPDWIRFALRRGYEVVGRHFGAVLELAGFNEMPFLPAVNRLEAEGIRFITLAEPHSPDLEHSLYELELESLRDDDEPCPTYAEWRKDRLENSQIPPEAIVVATDGRRAVGVTILGRTDRSPNLTTRFTGVLKAYRGRSIALAVQLMGIRAARCLGAHRIHTGGDGRYWPFLALNRKLGFQPLPSVYRCIKR